MSAKSVMAMGSKTHTHRNMKDDSWQYASNKVTNNWPLQQDPSLIIGWWHKWHGRGFLKVLHRNAWLGAWEIPPVSSFWKKRVRELDTDVDM